MTERRRGGFVALNFTSQNRESAVLRATTELFVQSDRPGPDEVRRYEELALHFLGKVPLPDRAYVADLLADCEAAPAAVLRVLAKDLIEVASPVLTRSTALSPLDLLMIIAGTGPLHHRLIANRVGLPGEVADALRMTGDEEVAAILEAKGGPKPRQEFRPKPEPPAPPADEPSAPEATDPFRPADFLRMSREHRLRWMAELSNRGVKPPPRATPRALEATLRTAFHSSQIVGFARKRQLDALVAAFAESLGIDRFTARRMVDDPSGEPLVLMVKAMGLPLAEAREILLLANPAIGLVIDTFFRLADLHAALEPTVAEALVAGWRGERPTFATQRHEPHFSTADGVRAEPKTTTRPTVEEERVRKAGA